MRSARSAVFLSFAIALASGVGSGCWKYAKDYCTSGASCASGICDMRTMGCVPVDAGADANGADVRDGAAASDGVIDMPTDGQAMSGCSTMNECHDPLLPACDVPTRSCVGCLQSADCTTAGKLVCEAASKTCVGCVQNTDCTTPGAQVCEPTSKTCVGCLQNTDCKVAGKGVCDMTARACVACLMNADCGGATPICDAKACRACAKDAECTGGPGICMADGHCAIDGETIYVQFNPAGCLGADGSSNKPFCAPNDGVAALSASRHVIVILGAASDRMTLSTSGVAPVVVGRKGSSGDAGSIPAGGANGLTVSSDHVLVRDISILGGTASTGRGIVVSGAATSVSLLRVTISNNMGLGVQADTGAALRMDECLVQGNLSGGVLVNGASYDIQNTIVAGNAYGLRFTASAISAGSQARFNTVIGAGGIALTCDPSNPQTVLASIVTGLNDSCTLANSITIAPTFDSARPFHLTAKLPCPLGDPATFPDHDIDGDSRTKPLDCGADQF